MIKFFRVGIFALIFLIFSSIGVVPVPGDDHNMKRSDSQVSYSNEVLPIIITTCAAMTCHGNQQPPILLTHKKISKFSKRIKERINLKENPMPPVISGKSLTADQINTITTWINQGSPEN